MDPKKVETYSKEDIISIWVILFKVSDFYKLVTDLREDQKEINVI